MVTNRKIINPAAGAIVMAFGIFLHTSMNLLPFPPIMRPVFISLFLTGAAGILIALGLQFSSREFRKGFLNNPVNFFSMGTWVAGISVSAKVILLYYPGFAPVVTVVIALNTLLYGYYIYHCLRHFYNLWRTPEAHAPHGVILLAAVATQSLVIVWNVLVQPDIPPLGVLFGLLMYTAGAIVIIRHYFWNSKGTLADDWSNTNCIFHGALSISGFAMVVSGSFTEETIAMFWWGTFAVLLFIESIELVRAHRRIRKYGWREGVFTYHISQWSRNFTFGMFFAFTSHVHTGLLLNVWGWVVILLLAAEVIIFMKQKTEGAPGGAHP